MALGRGFPDDAWPQDLKNEYAYDAVGYEKIVGRGRLSERYSKHNIVADIAADLDLLRSCGRYYAAVGIDMEIRTMESAAWNAFVQVARNTTN